MSLSINSNFTNTKHQVMSLLEVLGLQLTWSKYVGIGHLKISPQQQTIQIDSNKLRYLVIVIFHLLYIYVTSTWMFGALIFLKYNMEHKSKNVDFASKVFELVFLFGITLTDAMIGIQCFRKKNRQKELYKKLLQLDDNLQGIVDMTKQNKTQYRMNIMFYAGFLGAYLIFGYIGTEFNSWYASAIVFIHIRPYSNDMFLYQITTFVQAIYLRIKAMNLKLSQLDANKEQQKVLVGTVKVLHELVVSVNETFGEELAAVIFKYFLLYFTMSFNVYTLFFQAGNYYSFIFYFLPQTATLMSHIYYCTETVEEVIEGKKHKFYD